MAKASLFETLTGYESPVAAATGDSDLLGGAGAEEGFLAGEPGEVQFSSILTRLEEEMESDPRAAQKLADAFGVPPDKAILKQKLKEARKVVNAQHAEDSDLLGGDGGVDYVERFGADSDLLGASADSDLLGASADFSQSYVDQHVVELYRKDLPRIDLEPKLTRFEDDNVLGVLGWFVFNGLDAIQVPRRLEWPFPEQFGRISGAAKFRRHGADKFVYQLDAGAGGRTTVALFADFGTGLAHSRFIARQIHLNRYDAAVHLGDVYYTGTFKQYKEYFIEPLEPAIRAGTKMFVIPDNHDGYSGFHAYLKFLDRDDIQQQGSYFAIETEHVQLIGVDTIWHSDRGRIQDEKVRAWLEERIAAGRAAGRSNVLLTGHEPYNLGKNELEKLNGDVAPLANGGIDLWFWGNTHYCALFDRTQQTSFYGSCIGHGGYPYGRKKKSEAQGSFAPVLFLETGSRYEPTETRRDRGMNGFCSLDIEPNGDVLVRYIDWRGHERCTAKLAKQAGGGLRLVGNVVDQTDS